MILRNANIANLGDATGVQGSSTAGNLQVALHTADPSAGTQATNEATYTGYARVNVARDTSTFGAASSGSSTNSVAAITFAACTAGSNTITHVSVGYNSGVIIWSGALSASLAVSAGITPEFATSALTISES